MDFYWQDFDHNLTEQVVNFKDNLQDNDSHVIDQLRQAILKRTCGNKMKSRPKVLLVNSFPEPILKIPKQKVLKEIPLNIFDFDELEVARQLTLIEFDFYEKILPNELFGQSWSKEKTQHRAVNVLSMISRSNNVSMWICSLILEPARVKLRAKRYSFLVRVAEQLRNLNNFSTLMAFLAAFNNSAVNRLKFTRQLIPKKLTETLKELETLMSVEGSSKRYREALHNSNPPSIPYLGTSLSDLTFIDEGNPDYINELINMGKRMLTYRVISEIQRYQQIGYSLKLVEMIAKHVRDIPSRDEKTFGGLLYESSLAREPRGAEKVP